MKKYLIVAAIVCFQWSSYSQESKQRSRRRLAERRGFGANLGNFLRGNVSFRVLFNEDNVHAVDAEGKTSLHRAVLNGSLEKVKVLIGYGVDIDARDNSDMTALDYACTLCTKRCENRACLSASLVRELILGGADPNGKGNVHQRTPLYYALENAWCADRVCLKLFKEGACLHSKCCSEGFTTLTLACSQNRIDLVKILFGVESSRPPGKDQAIINRCDESGKYPLHYAVELDLEELCKILVDQGSVDMLVRDKLFRIPLHYVAYKNPKKSMATILLSKKPEEQLTYGRAKKTPIYCACDLNHVELVKFFLESVKQSIRSRLTRGVYNPGKSGLESAITETMRNILNASKGAEKTLLHISVKNPELIELLINSGVDIHGQAHDGSTALHAACSGHYHTSIEALIKHGAAVNQPDKQGKAPLHYACKKNKHCQADSVVRTIELLMDAAPDGSNLFEASMKKTGYQPFHFVCSYASAQVAQQLLEKYDIPLNRVSKDGTPLHIACKSGLSELIPLLIEQGCSVENTAPVGIDGILETPLHTATSAGQKEVIEQLITKNKALIGQRDSKGRNALDRACIVGADECASFLLRKERNLLLNKDAEGNTCLHHAAMNNHLSLCQKLVIDFKVPIEEENASMQRALHVAAQSNCKEVCDFLIEQGADRDAQDIEGDTALHKASHEGHCEIVAILAVSANCSLLNHKQCTALHAACSSSRATNTLVETLCDARCDGLQYDSKGLLAVHYAAKFGNKMVLLDEWKDLQTKDLQKTPLHIALEEGYDSVVEHLINMGANVQLCTKNGNTPLHYAARYNRAAMFVKLLKAKALEDVRNNKGKRPADLLHRDARLKLGQEQRNSINVSGQPGRQCDTFSTFVEPSSDTMVTRYLKNIAQRSSSHSPALATLATLTPTISTAALKGYLDHGANIALLTKLQSDKNLQKAGIRTMHDAARNGLQSILKRYIVAGFSCNERDEEGYTALHYAAQAGNAACCYYLLKHGADPSTTSDSGETAYTLAKPGSKVRKVLEEFVQERKVPDGDDNAVLPERGRVRPIPTEYIIPPPPSSNQLESSLFTALDRGTKADCLRRLLVFFKANENINASWGAGETALLISVKRKRYEIVELLLDAGADTHQEDSRGVWPLALAVLNKDQKMCELLKTLGSHVSHTSQENRTLFHFAAQANSGQLLTWLYDWCSDEDLLKTQDTDGQSALHYAARYDSDEAVAFLLEAGLDPLVQDNEGKTAWDILIEKGWVKSLPHFIRIFEMSKMRDALLSDALFKASRLGHIDLCEELLNTMKALSKVDEKGMTVYHHASLHGHKDLLIKLMGHNWDAKPKVITSTLLISDAVGRSPLHHAILSKSSGVVSALLARDRRRLKNALLSMKDDHGDTPLHVACRIGSEEVSRMLINNGAAVNDINNNGATPLHLACSQANDGLVHYLLNDVQGTNKHAVDAQGCSLLHYACRKSTKDVIKKIETSFQGLAPLAMLPNYAGHLPLHFATLAGRLDLVLLLLKGDHSTINRADHQGLTPLHLAVENNQEQICRQLITQRAEIDAHDNDGATPLHRACKKNNKGLAQLLLDGGASAVATTDAGNSSIHFLAGAEDDDREELLELLIGASRGVCSTANKDGNTPLHLAAQQGNIRAVRKLCSHTHSPHVINNEEYTPLMLAVMQGHREVAEFLIQQSAEYRRATRAGETLIHLAVLSGNVELLKLIKQCCPELDVNTKTVEQDTALHLVCRSDDQRMKESFYGNREELLRVLLSFDSIDCSVIGGREQCPPLFEALMSGFVGVCQLMCKQEVPDSDLSAFHVALSARDNRKELVAELLRVASDQIDEIDDEGMTPLGRAVYDGDEEIVELLLAHNAQVSCAHEKSGMNSPLHTAAYHNAKKVCRLLLERGADPQRENSEGLTPLMIAADNGFEDIVFLLLRWQADVNKVGPHGFTALHFSLNAGHETVSRVLAGSNAHCEQETEEGLRPIHIIARLGNVPLMNMLLGSVDLDRNARDKKGCTALYYAVDSKHYELVQLLGWDNADVTLANNENKTPLYRAVELGDENLVTLLLTARQNKQMKSEYCNIASSDGYTPLRRAAFGRSEKDEQGRTVAISQETMCRILLEQGADVNKADNKGLTPLHAAAQQGHLEVCKLLIGHGAKVNVVEQSTGYTPLHRALIGKSRSKECEKLCELLISSGAIIDPSCGDGCTHDDHPTMLGVAAKRGRTKLIRYLLSKGAKVNALNSQGDNSLHCSLLAGSNEFAQSLIEEHGADLNASNRRGETPLHYAIMKGNRKLFNVMLAMHRNANTSCLTHDGESLLHYACKYGQEKIARTVLLFKPSRDLLSRQGVTPLMYALKSNIHKIARIFVEPTEWDREVPDDLKINLDAQDIHGNKLIHYAAFSGNDYCIRYALRMGQGGEREFNVKNNNGVTPLMNAFRAGHGKFARILVSRGADPAAIDNAGNTILHHVVLGMLDDNYDSSAESRYHECVDRCLNAPFSGSPNARNNAGQTPVDLARLKKDTIILEKLLSHADDSHEESTQNISKNDDNDQHATDTSVQSTSSQENQPAASADVTDIPAYEELIITDGKRSLTLREGKSIHDAAKAGNLELIKDFGSAYDESDENGYSALHYAAYYGHEACCTYLLEQGCQIDYLNNHGETPIQLAQERNNGDIITLLTEFPKRELNQDQQASDDNSDDDFGEFIERYQAQPASSHTVQGIVDDNEDEDVEDKVNNLDNRV